MPDTVTNDQTAEQIVMQNIAGLLDDILNGGREPDEDRHIFALIIFTPGVIGGSHANWVSNGQRADMLAAMKEMVARFETHDQFAGGKAVLQ